MTLQKFVLAAHFSKKCDQPVARPADISESRWRAMWNQYNRLVEEVLSEVV